MEFAGIRSRDSFDADKSTLVIEFDYERAIDSASGDEWLKNLSGKPNPATIPGQTGDLLDMPLIVKQVIVRADAQIDNKRLRRIRHRHCINRLKTAVK